MNDGLEGMVQTFFDKWMPIYAMVVCLVCFLFLIVMGAAAIIGFVQRALT